MVAISFCLLEIFFNVLHSKVKIWQLYVVPPFLISLVNKNPKNLNTSALGVTLYLQWQIR